MHTLHPQQGLLPDIQKTTDKREVAIDRVGVTGIRLPIQIRRRPWLVDDRAEICATVGEFEMAVSLDASVKGTHMSRFSQVLGHYIGTGNLFSSVALVHVAKAVAKSLDARSAMVRMHVDYFMRQDAPVSAAIGMAPMRGMLETTITPDGNVLTRTGLTIEGKTCCPCSKEISDYDPSTGRGKGAHAQRSKVTMEVSHLPDVTIWFETLAEIAWRAFSQPVYPVLKRPDERHVTMGAYENPKFVEDVIRDVVCQLRDYPLVGQAKVRVQNAESIHYHDAFAEVEIGGGS